MAKVFFFFITLLGFNAQAYLLQVYAGASGARAFRKDDHYIELEIGSAKGKNEASWLLPRKVCTSSFATQPVKSTESEPTSRAASRRSP